MSSESAFFGHFVKIYKLHQRYIHQKDSHSNFAHRVSELSEITISGTVNYSSCPLTLLSCPYQLPSLIKILSSFATFTKETRCSDIGYKWFGRYIQNQEYRYTSIFWIKIWDIPLFVGGEGFGLSNL